MCLTAEAEMVIIRLYQMEPLCFPSPWRHGEVVGQGKKKLMKVSLMRNTAHSDVGNHIALGLHRSLFIFSH